MPTPTPSASTRAARTRAEADAAFLRRIERTALAVVLVATVAGGVLGGLPWAGGILGGGLLAGISYWAIRSSVDALMVLMGSAGDGLRAHVSPVRIAVSVLGRHALLAVVAYVIIARLRLHPVGVLVGASAVVLAATREAFRGARPGSRS